MVSVSQTDHSQRDKLISYMNAQADLHQYFLFAYGAYRLCQVELQNYVT